MKLTTQSWRKVLAEIWMVFWLFIFSALVPLNFLLASVLIIGAFILMLSLAYALSLIFT